ncbi:MAG TPA: ester cyclase [Rhizomicrobium sp.]|nr:ester cyclase [Rhizomicrobium sp.]
MTTDAQRKEILTRFLDEIWNKGTIEAAGSYIAAEYAVRHDPGDAWHGKTLTLDDYKARLRAALTPFPDQHFAIQELYADNGNVVVTWLWSATHKGDIPGLPATGRQVSMSGATVYYFDGEKLTGHWQIIDRLGVFQQLRAPAG